MEVSWLTMIQLHHPSLCQTSPVGLVAILTQTHNGGVGSVAYASRTLTVSNVSTLQLENEALAMAWGCNRFHLYPYTTKFELYTDSKLSEAIFHPQSKLPARVERWTLCLQSYCFKVIYTTGKGNPTDVLSCLPFENQPVRERNIAEEYINGISCQSVPKAMSF